tara:strand:- start:952 stop:2232 length:1281 start_codon:yes stop_codon:yes gene_type:complete
MAKFTGLQSNFYTGVVEDRNDPLEVGRVRVRIYGLHTDDKTLIATPDLPWSDVLMPTSTASLSGLGMSPHGLVEGTTVMGMFRDEQDMQDFVVMGSLFGLPNDTYKIPNGDSTKAIPRSAEHGFNDPRRDTQSDYIKSKDGIKASTNGRNWQLFGALDTSPRIPTDIELREDGSGALIVNPEKGERYPLDSYTKLSRTDVNKLATTGGAPNDYPNNLIKKTEGSQVKELPRKNNVKPVYPYNHVIQSESGHVLELDDTPKTERLHLYHRSGTRLEVLADGSQTMKVVNDSYEIILKDKKILIGGNADIELMNGSYVLNAKKGSSNDGGNVFINTDADCNISSGGSTNVLSEGKITITGNNTTEIISDTTVTGTLHVTGAQTNDSTIHAKKDISTDAGESPTLATHKHDTLITGGSSKGTYTSIKGK